MLLKVLISCLFNVVYHIADVDIVGVGVVVHIIIISAVVALYLLFLYHLCLLLVELSDRQFLQI